MSHSAAPLQSHLETLPRSLNVLLGLCLLALLAFPFVGTDFYVQMVSRMMILAIFAMSLDLLQGDWFSGGAHARHSFHHGDDGIRANGVLSFL